MCRQTAGLAVLGLLFASLSFAQTTPVTAGAGVPPIIRFSGTLTVPAGQVPVTFGLYADQTGGEPLWQETQTIAVDAAGRYAVVFGTATPLPTEVFVSGEARWLDVAVEGLAPQPRALLVSVPYALKSADAETIGGKPLSAFVFAGEKTGVGTDGLTYVNTRVLARSLAAAGGEVGTLDLGTANFVAKFGAGGVADTNSSIFDTGYVGIGTTSPSQLLTIGPAIGVSVGPTLRIQGDALSTPGGSTVGSYGSFLLNANNYYSAAARRFLVTNAFDYRKFAIIRSADAFTDPRLGAAGTLTSGTADVVIDHSGLVGISTPDPLYNLDVNGTGRFTSTVTFNHNAVMANNRPFYWLDNARGWAHYGAVYLDEANGMNFVTGAAIQMALTSDGRLGIGTGAPAQKLSVAGTVESTTGGFKFPDGTLQTSASGAAGNPALHNTVSGTEALASNTTGASNTAVGTSTLAANTTGYDNTAIGTGALLSNITGYYNTAVGTGALLSNTTGYYNIANGTGSLLSNTTGFYNAASGDQTLRSNTTGQLNTAIGHTALIANTTGSNNTAFGNAAGSNLTTGSNNIDIGNPGVAAESNTIRIGTAGVQSQTFIAGIRGVGTGTADAVGVLIDSNGQLGTINSSRRVKDDVADMAGASSGLMNLRPVTFHYLGDQNPAGRTLQYGLIAEEVAEVYPGLVAHSADGQIETVLYQFLPPMLLNELQKQQRTIEALRAQVAASDAQTRKLADQVAALTRAMAALGDRRQ